MTYDRKKPKGNWKLDHFMAVAAKYNEDWFAVATKEALQARIIELTAAINPFVTVLGSLDSTSWRGTTASSGLFPIDTLEDQPDNTVAIYVAKADGTMGKFEFVPITDETIADLDYITHDSLTINKGENIGDDFNIMTVHQEAPGTYCNCGEISMGDVRILKEVYYRHRGMHTMHEIIKDDDYIVYPATEGKTEVPIKAILDGPDVEWKHVDGPMLSWATHIHWLTWKERLRIKLGLAQPMQIAEERWPYLANQYLALKALIPTTSKEENHA